MDKLNENSTAVLVMIFKDEFSSIVTPTKVTYRIDDRLSGDEIRGDTDFVPVSGEYNLSIFASENRIINDSREYEIRMITIIFYYGVGKQGTSEYRYKVVNLKKIL